MTPSLTSDILLEHLAGGGEIVTQAVHTVMAASVGFI